MRVKVITRQVVSPFMVVDTVKREDVGQFAFRSGDAYYFKKDRYNYNVLFFNPATRCFMR